MLLPDGSIYLDPNAPASFLPVNPNIILLILGSFSLLYVSGIFLYAAYNLIRFVCSGEKK